VLSPEAAAGPDLRDYLQVLRRRKSIILLAIAVVLGVAMAASYLQRPRYAATAKLLLKPASTRSLFDTGVQANPNPARSVQTEIEVIRPSPCRIWFVRGSVAPHRFKRNRSDKPTW